MGDRKPGAFELAQQSAQETQAGLEAFAEDLMARVDAFLHPYKQRPAKDGGKAVEKIPFEAGQRLPPEDQRTPLPRVQIARRDRDSRSV